MLEDIASASSSVHINQFGFRPGVVGDAFAEALIAKAAEGVPVRLVVDRQGSDPERGARALYERLRRRDRDLRRARDAGHARRPVRSAARETRAGTSAARAHRPSQGGGHRRPRRLGGRRRDRGSLPGRALPRPVRTRHRPGRRPAAARVRRRLPLARGRRRGTEIDALFPQLEGGDDPVPAIVLHNAPGAYRPITDAIGRLLDGAEETLDVVNPYVTDRGMIRRIEWPRGGAFASVSSSPRTRTTGPAPRRSSSTTRSCSTRASASSSTRRCCTRRRSCATGRSSSRERATSKPGA